MRWMIMGMVVVIVTALLFEWRHGREARAYWDCVDGGGYECSTFSRVCKGDECNAYHDAAEKERRWVIEQAQRRR